MKKKVQKEPKSHSSVVPPAPIWKIILGWGACAWIVFVAFRFDQKFPVSLDPTFNFLGGFADFSLIPFLKSIPGPLKSLVCFFLISTGALSWGSLATANFIDETTPPLARGVLSCLVGLIGLSFLVTVLGFLGFLKPAPLFSITVLFFLAGLFLDRQRWIFRKTQFSSFKMASLIDSPVKILLVILCALAFFMAFIPEIFYDSLVYHLGLPQMYINEGRILDTPHVYFSRSPMLIHMLYTLSVGLDGSTLAKLINCLFLMLGVAGSFVLCDLLGWRKAGPWAAVIFIAIPIVQMNVWTTAVDSAMGGVFAMAAYSLLRWRESERKIFWALMAGLFSGSVFAIKYPGLLVTVLMGGILILLSLKRLKEKPVILSLVIYVLLSGAAISPWLVRNFIWTGNPVYPILSSVFESRHMNHEKMEQEKTITKKSKPESLGAFLSYPWKQTMLEISNFNFIGPMILGLLPLILFLPFKDPSVRVFLLITFGYFLLELQVLGELRYIMPGFLLLGVLLAGGMGSLSQVSKICGGALKILLFGVALYHLAWIFAVLDSRYLPWPVIWGKQSRDDYSATMHNGLNLWPWGVMAEDLRKLPESSRVYILGTEQVFGFPRRFWYSSCHDDTPLVLWTNASASASDLYRNMHDQGFTHILLNVPEAMRLKDYKLFPWTESGRKIFIEFANKYLTLVNVKPISGYPNSLFLFELRDQNGIPHPFGDFSIYFEKIMHLGAS